MSPRPSGRRSEEHERDKRAPFDLAIRTELARYLVRQAPTGFAVGFLTVALVTFVLRNAVPYGALVLWVATIGVLTLPSPLIVWAFGRSPDPSARIRTWERLLTAAYGLAGAGWGAAAVILYPRVAMPYQLFLLFILGGSGVGGMAALSPIRSAFFAYLATTFVPMAVMLLAARTHSSVATGFLLLAFGIATMVLGSQIRDLLVRSLRLRFENLELIDDLSTAKEAAEAASRTKTQILANMSHELRTPLALILGPVRKILSGTSDSSTRRDLETVERNAQVLLKHVSDLLDVAKLETGRLEVHRAPVDLATLTRRTTSLFESVAGERRVALTVEAPDVLPILGDAAKLERVLLNLLSNAMKFVPDGGRVRVAVETDASRVVLVVEDDGPGIPDVLREVVFEPFRRGDDDTTRRFGGTGLGLTIAKEIVERHGGLIVVGDGIDGGARFTVELPHAAVPYEPAAAARPPADRAAPDEVVRQTIAELRAPSGPGAATEGDGAHGLVLVIEDNVEMSRFLADCLRGDYRVATASDGREGLEQALALKPDCILTDVMMPVMGGEALVRALCARRELEGIPIVVLTAKADEELRVHLLREGVQDYLTKPVVPEELHARVRNIVTLKRTRDVLQGAVSSQSRDLATLADQLAAASRTKDEFLAVLSHELRTPLTAILTWSMLLREPGVDAATLERGLRTIERNSKLQARVIDDLLDVSRVIMGKLRLSLRPVAVKPVVHAAIDSLRPAADAKGIRLAAVVDAEPVMVSGDPERLQQVVWNLVSNAIKFTARGGRIEIRLGQDGEHVRLVVTDDGAGIDPAMLPRLFDRFWQADSSTTRAHGGLGLGLAVVRHLVELHGGTVRAQSEGEGRGATFTVTLPALAVHARANDPPHDVDETRSWEPALRLQGLRVLVVDDDQDTCETLGAVLEAAGAEVRTCISASQALAAIDAWVPDLIVSDIAMPGDDGYTLIRRIRARKSEEGGRMLAVALTAYNRSEDRVKALSAGFHVHVGKPIEPSQLVSVVASVTGHTGGMRH
jgi:signal transduction histidine kinase